MFTISDVNQFDDVATVFSLFVGGSAIAIKRNEGCIRNKLVLFSIKSYLSCLISFRPSIKSNSRSCTKRFIASIVSSRTR